MQVVSERSRAISPTISARRIEEKPFTYWLEKYWTQDRESNRIGVVSRTSTFRLFMRWLVTQPGYETLAGSDLDTQGRELLVRHVQAEDAYVMVDLVERYIQRGMQGKRRKSKQRSLSDIRAFFKKNHAPLPESDFKVHGDKPPIRSALRPDVVRRMILALDPMYASVVLCKWQGLLDTKRLLWVNQNSSAEIAKQIRGGTRPVSVWLPGRKQYENDPDGDYYTYWGKDAIDGLTNYWDNMRPGGWPKAGEPIWVYRSDRSDIRGKPIRAQAFREKWKHQLNRMGIIDTTQPRDSSTRYGFGMHDMRDEAKTLLHVKALRKGLDMDCVKLWMGDIGDIDRNKYDKFMRERDYVREQYLIAEPWLNIISNPNPDLAAVENEKTKNMQQRIEALEQIVKRFEKMTDTTVILPI